MTTRPLRIVHVVATAIGAPWMVALAREQKRLGHDVMAVIPTLDGGVGAALREAGVACHAAPSDILSVNNRDRVRLIYNLVRLLRLLRPDVVHSHILNSVVSARIASWLADVPNHFGGNVGPLNIESPLLKPLEIGTAFCDTKSIASCRHTRELFIKHGVPAEKVELIYYAVDQSGYDPTRADGARVRRELGIAETSPVIGKIAYFYPPASTNSVMPAHLHGRGVKGHDVLIRAVPCVLESFPDAKFVLVGRGWNDELGQAYERELKDLVVSLGVSDAVLFPGERRDVPDVLAAFDVSVHCSHTDNLAGTVESLLMAKPMVVSDIPGFRDTVLHEKTGLLVPPDDPHALADSIVRLLRDRELAQRLGANGRAFMLERFTLARTVADFEELFTRTMARAEQHYRLTTTLARLIAAPFRLYPVMRGYARAAGAASLSLRLYYYARRAISRAVRLVIPRRTRAEDGP